MKTIALVVLFAFTTQAQEAPKDAPLADFGKPLPAAEMKKGDPFPFDDGLALNGPQAVAQAKRIVNCEATLTKAEESWLLKPPVVIAGLAAAAAIGAAIATAVMLGAQKKQ